jgi:hypothetical protein
MSSGVPTPPDTPAHEKLDEESYPPYVDVTKRVPRLQACPLIDDRFNSFGQSYNQTKLSIN